jgi:alpha-L-rhamnosidase
LLGKTAEEKEYADLAAGIKEAFNRAFYDEATGTYSKGSATGMSCALYFGLVDEKNRQKVADIFAESLKKNDYTVTVGCLGSKYLLRALAETGHLDTAYRIVTKTSTPGWGFLASSNRTTLSEKLDGGGSDNHAFLGDVASWIMTYLGGIRADPAHPGFQRFLIKPEVVGDLTWVKARHVSPYGRIVSDWKKEGDRFSLDLTVPPNSTAEVSLPTDHPDSVAESGKPVSAAPGVKFLRGENGRELYGVGAGSYHFECRITQQNPTP